MIYDISYKNVLGPKPLLIRFDKIDGFIKTYDGTRYLTLFGYEIYDAICKQSLKSSVSMILCL